MSNRDRETELGSLATAARKGSISRREFMARADAAFAGAVDAAVLYKEHAAPVGIDINVVREPNDGYWSNVWMNKPWGMCYWGGRPTEDWMFSTGYAADAGWNDTFWKHDRFNKLLVLARGELDQALRREMYVEMQRIVSDEGGVVVPLFNNYVFAMSDKVRHGELAGNWDLDGSKLTERWWFGGAAAPTHPTLTPTPSTGGAPGSKTLHVLEKALPEPEVSNTEGPPHRPIPCETSTFGCRCATA